MMKLVVTIFVFMVLVAAVCTQNIEFCEGTGYTCSKCTQCWPGGWCVTNAFGGPKCLCKYGWVGYNAVYDDGLDANKKNLMRADSCSKACHYTPHVR